MKIKTITCHNVYNFGASLQAYALSRYLMGLGHDIQIIDYVPDYLTHYKLFGTVNPVFDRFIVRGLYQMAKFPGRLFARYGSRKKTFDRFTARYLPLTDRHYFSYEELLAYPPDADVYIAGSDQIWNSYFQNGRDPAFYLQFAPHDRIKASYAASFAISEIAPEHQEQTKQWLSDLDYISVRESSGVKILEQLGIAGGISVVDPVFLLSLEQWNELCLNQEPRDPYVLVYDCDNNYRIREIAESLAKEQELKIYTLQKLGYGDIYISNAGPIEFLQLIKGASYVLSNSFHATAFSLIFHRPFCVFDREEEINTRMRDLVSFVDLEWERAPDAIIDWNNVQEKLDGQISFSKEYIRNVLERSMYNG